MRACGRIAAWTAAWLTAAASADLSPESVALVVNGDSWASLTVANEYVHLREIPACNVVVLHGLSAFDTMDVEHFRKEVLGPVLSAIEARGLAGQIDCVTYSVDLPTAVHVGPDTKGHALPQVITPVASANGLTYLHEWVMAKDTDYLRLDINRYARRVLPIATGRTLNTAELSEYQRALGLYEAKKWDEAAAAMDALAAEPRSDASLYYNLACCRGLLHQGDAAMSALRRAVAQGWRDAGHTAGDTDLESLRGRADFQALLKEMQARRVEVQPTIAFDAAAAWDERGEAAAEGPHYLLSTVLGVTSGRGNSVAEVVESLRRAAGADGTTPRGTVYIEKNGDVRSTTREWAFADLQRQLGSLGVACVVEDGVLPQKRRDVAGAVIGTAGFDWPASGSVILPGAICEHLTSCGGMMGERDTQTPCTEFIRAGAAGSSGAVTEPYALQAKFPSPFMQLHYARGSTLAEAFYQSVEGPYQLLILGDPMCRPWGRRGAASATGLSRDAVLKGVVEVRPRGDGAFALYVDGKPTASCAAQGTLTLDTGRFEDGEHTVSLVGERADALRSRDRSEVRVRFANGGGVVRLVSRPPSRAEFGGALRVPLACEGAETLEVLHFGEVVGRIAGPAGDVEIETARLGMGSVSLETRARVGDGVIWGPRVQTDVSLAPIARRGVGRQAIAGGLMLVVADGPASAVADTFDPAWIAGAAAGREFTIEDSIEAATGDLYQIQVRTNTGARVEIDGSVVIEAAPAEWVYAPAQLAPGSHWIRVTGKAPESGARLDLRVGAAGTRHLPLR
ncbi:MAG: hypothetical protein IPJ41_12130 [Phycisphaerales bacterium]|nr:hypothetical protein [Phycisphaerales bacterium]